jgi:hypothetical protein
MMAVADPTFTSGASQAYVMECVTFWLVAGKQVRDKADRQAITAYDE